MNIRYFDARKVGALVLVMIVLIVSCMMPREHAVGASLSGVATVSFNGYLMGVENKYYEMDLNGTVLFYKSDGSTYTKTISGKDMSKRRHMILTDVSTGEEREGYCIEYNAEIKSSAAEYTGSAYLKDTIYFYHLPKDVKRLILATTYYGQNGENTVPVSGANAEDYYFATQMLIWECQQQIRVFDRDSSGNIVGTKRVASHGMSSDYFYKWTKGRAAEKCYNFIVENMNNHFVVPDFVGETADDADAITMNYDMETRSWKASLSSSTDFKMKWSTDGITYSRDGNNYIFTTENAIEGDKVVKVKRQTAKGASTENLLIWNNNTDSDLQVLATGSASPPEYFLRLKTDVPCEVTVQKKDAETGNPIETAGTQYKVKNIDTDKFVSDGMSNDSGDIYSTDKSGKVTIGEKLQAGDYVLEEIKAPKGYVVASDYLEFTVDGLTSEMTLEQSDTPQKGIITIKKLAEYRYLNRDSDIREKVMGGIDFDIVALSDIVTPDGTVRATKGEIVDTVRTDFKGNVSTNKLYLGPYQIVERETPDGYKIAEPVEVILTYGDQNEEVIEKSVTVLNRLEKIENSPSTGDYHYMYHYTLILLFSVIVFLGVFLGKFGKKRG